MPNSIMFLEGSPFSIRIEKTDSEHPQNEMVLCYEGTPVTEMLDLQVRHDWNGSRLATATVTVPLSSIEASPSG